MMLNKHICGPLGLKSWSIQNSQALHPRAQNTGDDYDWLYLPLFTHMSMNIDRIGISNILPSLLHSYVGSGSLEGIRLCKHPEF